MWTAGLGATLDAWLTRRILAATAVALAGLVGIALAGRVGQVASLPEALPLLRAARPAYLLALVLVPLLGFALPLAFFAGVAAVLADLRESGGWDSCQLAGASPARLLPRLLVLAAAVGLVSGALSAWGDPWGRHGLRHALADAASAWSGPADGPLDLDLSGWRLVGAASGGALRDVVAVSPDGLHVAAARSGQVAAGPGRPRLVLEEGSYDGRAPGATPVRVDFGRLALALPERAGRPSRETYELPPADLRRKVLRARERGRPDRGAELAWARRLAYPLTPLALAALAVPAGLGGRRGGLSRAMVLALAAGLVYYAVLRWADGAVPLPPRGIGLPPALAAAAPLTALGALAAAGWARLRARPPGRRR